jgi:hypothetical protein
MKNLTLSSMTLLAALILPGVALADDTTYVGADFGGATYNLDTTSNYGSGSDAVRLMWGWEFNPNFSVELNYTDFGDQSDYFDSGAPHGGGFSQDLTGHGVGITFIGSHYISDNWSIFGRVGTTDTSMEINQNDYSGDVFNATDHGWHPMLGVGMAFDFGPTFTVHFGIDSFQDVGNSATTGHGNITLGYIGLVTYF